MDIPGFSFKIRSVKTPMVPSNPEYITATKHGKMGIEDADVVEFDPSSIERTDVLSRTRDTH